VQPSQRARDESVFLKRPVIAIWAVRKEARRTPAGGLPFVLIAVDVRAAALATFLGQAEGAMDYARGLGRGGFSE
jgi:hypothetical protein